jgi:hydroxycarboxylate dehydrogenase B
MIVAATTLKATAFEILTRAGATTANADCVAAHLVNANLCGVDTHGVWQLPGYVAAIQRGELMPGANPEVLIDAPAFALVTGNWGFGQVAALEATQQALRKAKTCGIAIVSVVRSHHIGRLGEYAELTARQSFISMIWASGLGEEKPDAIPYGGRKPIFGTNPLAVGLPAAGLSPVVIDFATSATSGVKIIDAVRTGSLLPPGFILDRHGNATTDPCKVRDGGGQLAFGGHKGSALMLATEVLGRILAGADSYVEPPLGGDSFSHQGMTIVALKADLFQPLQAFLERTDELRRRLRAVPPAPGFKEVSAPGDPEMRVRAVREGEGVPIPNELWQTLVDLAAREVRSTATAAAQSGREATG